MISIEKVFVKTTLWNSFENETWKQMMIVLKK